jgi:hypothetical protein
LPLLDLYANASVPVNGAYYLIFDTEGSDECFESSKFVEWTRKLVKENKIAGLQMRSQGAEDKERGRKHVSVQIDYQLA